MSNSIEAIHAHRENSQGESGGKMIYVFFNESSTIKYKIGNANGYGWNDEKYSVANASIVHDPAAVCHNGTVYCFYQGGNGAVGNHSLWYAKLGSDGRTWTNVQVDNISLSYSPCVVSYKGKIYCLYHGSQGPRPTGELWMGQLVEYNDAGKLRARLDYHSRVENVRLRCTPSAAVFRDKDDDGADVEKLVCFYEGTSSPNVGNGELWYAVYFKDAWESHAKVENVQTWNGPSPVWCDPFGYCFYHGGVAGGSATRTLWYGALNLSTGKLDGNTKIANVGNHDRQSAVNVGGAVICFYHGAKGIIGTNQLWYGVVRGDQLVEPHTYFNDVTIEIGTCPSAVMAA